MSRNRSMLRVAAATLAVAGAGLTAVAQAASPQLELVDRPAERFERAIKTHKEQVQQARKERARKEARAFELAGGVSQATLDAIAACESGGDPTAVNPAGYYGKYQFDTGTWASVGGSGNPAEASEEEQDYRASLLYARAGSSPWPVCGQ